LIVVCIVGLRCRESAELVHHVGTRFRIQRARTAARSAFSYNLTLSIRLLHPAVTCTLECRALAHSGIRPASCLTLRRILSPGAGGGVCVLLEWF
jgi:hypothetical protein